MDISTLKSRVQGWFPKWKRNRVGRIVDAVIEEWPTEAKNKRDRNEILRKQLKLRGFPWSALVQLIIWLVQMYLNREVAEGEREYDLAYQAKRMRKL
jgi:hypothetical protein